MHQLPLRLTHTDAQSATSPPATAADRERPNPIDRGLAASSVARRPNAHRRRGCAGAPALQLDAQAELGILEALKANLTVHHELLDDGELMMILAEGETSLLEALDAMLEADLADDGLIVGLKQNRDTMAVRLHRLEERRRSRRAILEQALLLLERKSLERPCATISLSERVPSLVVEEEAQIPARFFDLKPSLNRRLVKQALEAGEDIAGAKLSNGCVTLTVRRR